MPTKKVEYRILPQGERDDYHSHIRSGTSISQQRVTTQYFCVFAFTLALIVLILAGVAALTASMFYSEQVNKTFGHFWFGYSNESTGTTTSASVLSSSGNESSSQRPTNSTEDQGNLSHTTTLVGNENSTFNTTKNSTRHESNKFHRHHHHHEFAHHNTSGNSSEIDSIDNDRNNFNSSSISSSESSEEEDSDSDMENQQQQTLDMEDFKEKFAETMRDLEKRMENLTGIRKAEFVVPMFMLIAFLILFSTVSLCCCVLMKRKDKRRRKLFGKLITDLQTGDSKTVLLNNMDLDE